MTDLNLLKKEFNFLEKEIKNGKLNNTERKQINSKLDKLYLVSKESLGKNNQFLKQLNSLKTLLKKSEIKREKKGLINLITETKDMEKYADTFLEKYDDKDEISYDDFIVLFENLAHYFKNTKEEFEDKEIDLMANQLIELYKMKYKAKELDDEGLEKFRLYVNIILFSLGFYPLKKDGKNMSEAETNTFEDTYNKF